MGRGGRGDGGERGNRDCLGWVLFLEGGLVDLFISAKDNCFFPPLFSCVCLV